VALLSFPASPVNGQLYPVAPVVGQNQYQWEAATNTWRLVGTATGVIPGIYGDVDNIPQITIDATGKITVATNIAIGANYVKTNNTSAYNSYVWPNSDGGASDFLTTDGSGNLSWLPVPFTNYWQLLGSTLLPSTDGYNLALTDSLGNITFFSDATTSETDFINGTTSVVISPNPAGISAVTVSGGGNVAKPLGFSASDHTFSAFGNSFLNAPSTLTLTQSLLETSTPFNSASSITANSGTANSITTPPTRGTAGQILITNGDGTTAWITNPEQGWWSRSGTNIYPENPGDTVQVRSLASIPVIELKPDGNALFIDGQQNLQIDPGYAAGEVEIRVNDFPGAGILSLDASSLNLRAYDTAFTNPPVQFLLDYTDGITFNADFIGTRRNLFNVDLNGSITSGYNVVAGYPAFFADGTNGNVNVAGVLKVNTGIAFSPTPNSYEFPNNRGLNGYVLTTDGAGGTQWQSASALNGYWTQSGSTLDIYPTLAGQNVFIRDNTSTDSIQLFSDGYIIAYGGDINAPTYSVANNGTGMYGTNSELDFAINAGQVVKIDQNYLYNYGDFQTQGTATIAGATAEITNDNANLTISASIAPLVIKNIVFEIAQNVQAGIFNTTGDFAVVQGNATIGSSSIITYTDSINLAVGNVSSNQAGLIKFVSAFNAGNGVELTQDEISGDFEIHMNHAAAPVVTVNATDTDLATNLAVTGDTTLSNELFLPAPTVPPASNSPGTKGQISWDANYVYVCIATNTWKRTALTTW
jgi:hypothetical protein